MKSQKLNLITSEKLIIVDSSDHKKAKAKQVVFQPKVLGKMKYWSKLIIV